MCRADIPVCRFGRLSSRPKQKHGTGMSREPAGWKACATDSRGFLVSMQSKYEKRFSMNTKPSTPAYPLSEALSRRHFSKLLATSALGTLVAPAFPHGQNLNSKLNIAIIGAGGRGTSNMGEVGKSENIVAVCDVAEAALDSAEKKFPEAKRFTDFRKLYEAEKEFDAVVVSTCEHTHAFATLPALKLRKHVYCEKPLTYNIWEARAIREAAAKAKVATQMGTQIHAGDNYRRVVELVQSGTIGPVREVHVWVGAKYGGMNLPTETPPVPAGLHYDLWLGPVEYRPYHPSYVPFNWRNWWAFGGGT